MSKPKLVRKMRIAVHKSGKVLTWSPTLNTKEDFYNGWRYIYDDGTVKDELDKSEAVELGKTSTSARERQLQEEVARLTQALQTAGIPLDGSAPAPKVDKPETVPIPEMPSDLEGATDLTALPPIEEPTFTPRPEAKDKSKAALARMKVETLIVHAHDLKSTVDLPDDATRDQLAAICWDLQEERKAAQSEGSE